MRSVRMWAVAVGLTALLAACNSDSGDGHSAFRNLGKRAASQLGGDTERR
jgi:hypothetical protein